jgi:hypothetical protein
MPEMLCIFNISLQDLSKTWKRKCHEIEIGLKEQCLYTLQFADDQTVITNDREDI